MIPWIRMHPIFTVVMAVGFVATVVLGYYFLPQEWSTERRLLCGVFGGVFNSICLIAGHIFRP